MLCAAVVLSTLAFGTVHSWTIGLFAAGAGAVVLLWAADGWRTGALRVSRNALQWPLVGLFAVGLVQLLPFGEAVGGDLGLRAAAPVHALSLDPYATRFVLIQLAALAIYFAAALVFVDSPRRLRLMVRLVTVFGFLLALFALLQHFINPETIYWLRQPKQSVPFGPFINRHHFAGYMELTIALPLGLLFTGAVEQERRLLYGFAVALMTVALVLTGSRGGMLSVAAEVLLLIGVAGAARRGQNDKDADAGADARRGALSRALLLRAGVGALVIVALLIGALWLGGEESLGRLVGTVNSEDPTSGRAQFWRGAVEVVKHYPVLGAGLGAFGVAYPPFDPLNGTFRLEQAHNDYLQILADAGIVGGALGLVFVVVLLRTGFARLSGSPDRFRRGVAAGALAGCVAVLVHSCFDFTLHMTSNALLFLVLAALATLDARIEDPDARRRRRGRSTHARRIAD